MPIRDPVPDAHSHGLLNVGDGNQIYWESRGAPEGTPVVVLHGGPGAGSSPGHARIFDPTVYRIILFDQRGCGRSTPNAGDVATDLSTNTTHHLIDDIEQLRAHLDIDSWAVYGVSWGTTLGLAYAQRHPDRVTAMLLCAVTNTTRREVEWVTRDMGRVFPEQWQRFRDAAPEHYRDDDLARAYADLLAHPDSSVRAHAARTWCEWEDTHVATAGNHTPDSRYDDPHFRMTFARLVTHYWSHAAFLDDGELERGITRLNGIPAILVHGRRDISGPPDLAWRISRAWPDAELVLVDDAGHSTSQMADALIAAATHIAQRAQR